MFHSMKLYVRFHLTKRFSYLKEIQNSSLSLLPGVPCLLCAGHWWAIYSSLTLRGEWRDHKTPWIRVHRCGDGEKIDTETSCGVIVKLPVISVWWRWSWPWVDGGACAHRSPGMIMFIAELFVMATGWISKCLSKRMEKQDVVCLDNSILYNS